VPKYHTETVYYPPDVRVADGNLGHYINELRDKGIDRITIVAKRRPHSDHQHSTSIPEEHEYTSVQGNVGSS